MFEIGDADIYDGKKYLIHFQYSNGVDKEIVSSSDLEMLLNVIENIGYVRCGNRVISMRNVLSFWWDKWE